MLDNGDLYVKDASEHDNTYSFRCHVENTITKEKKISKNYARVIVTGKRAIYFMRLNVSLNIFMFQFSLHFITCRHMSTKIQHIPLFPSTSNSKETNYVTFI